jgi:Protein of unknown function (DUF2934)
VRAYAIYTERGATPGQDVNDWLQAEAELAVLSETTKAKPQLSKTAEAR